MPVKRVYTPELLLKMRRDMEAGEDFRELETERLVVTKVGVLTLCAKIQHGRETSQVPVHAGGLCGGFEQCLQVCGPRPTSSI